VCYSRPAEPPEVPHLLVEEQHAELLAHLAGECGPDIRERGAVMAQMAQKFYLLRHSAKHSNVRF
jgi:hypothetical protein